MTMSRKTVMTSASKNDLEDYGLARVRDIAFDAVHQLWRRRCAAGVTQKELAARLNRDPSWISRQLSGPGNWTFRSFGALVEALEGEVEIIIHPLEDPESVTNGFDAYKQRSALGDEHGGKLFNSPKRLNGQNAKRRGLQGRQGLNSSFHRRLEKRRATTEREGKCHA